MFDVITIGSATKDVFVKSEAFELRRHKDSPTKMELCLPLGTKVEIKEIIFSGGGGGANAAVTFARQGFNAACVGVTGNDLAGQEVINELQEEGVNTDFFQKHDDDITAYSVILVNPSGERTIFSYKGEGQHFDVNLIPFEKLRADWFFLDSLGGHFEILEGLVGQASRTGAKIAFNPGGKELAHGLEKLKPILEKVDVFISNKEEAAGLLDLDFSDYDGIMAKILEIVKGVIVISDGPNGVRVKDKEGNSYQAGIVDSPVVERTGAGDAFGSGFVSEYIRSGNIKKAIQFATANASSVVAHFGARAGILKKGDFGPWPLVEVEVN